MPTTSCGSRLPVERDSFSESVVKTNSLEINPTEPQMGRQPRSIFCVSFPRAGCTWFKECLQLTMGDDFRYCEGYKETFDPTRHNFLKSHDFDLAAEPPEGFGVILQLRYPLDAVASWWNLKVKEGTPDGRQQFEDWAPSAIEFFNRLRSKWEPKSLMTIWHDDLIQWPHPFVSMASRYMANTWTGHSPYPTRLSPIRSPSSSVLFQHYDFEFFRHLDSLLT